MESLRNVYCPPLDESLFLALAGDCDFGNAAEVDGLRSTLDMLKENAVEEQEQELATPLARDFDGIGQITTHGDTATSNTSNGTSGLSPSENAHTEDGSIDTSEPDLRSLSLTSAREKEDWLKDMFPFIDDVQITETVIKCAGHLQSCIDELLNLSFITEDITQPQQKSEPVARGIDAFLGDGKQKKTRKKRDRRRKGDLYDSDDASISGSSTPALNSNVWKSATEDIDFIINRTQIAPAYARQVYDEMHKNIASTIRRLVAQEADKHRIQIMENQVLGIQAEELKYSFPKVPQRYLFGALLLCQMQPSVAKEVLDVMLSQPSQHEDPLRPGTKLSKLAQYTPLNLTDDEELSVERPRSSGLPTIAGSSTHLMSDAALNNARAQHAFASASAAARRAKSNHLYGGAAAYYASEGHDARARNRALRAAAADSFVIAQSTPTSVDLHGVTVSDAVRISQQKAETWWDNLGDKKYIRGGVGSGFKVIVGVGTHSENGIGRLGPAVSKALLKNGWKVNVQRGEIYVEGKARR